MGAQFDPVLSLQVQQMFNNSGCYRLRPGIISDVGSVQKDHIVNTAYYPKET